MLRDDARVEYLRIMNDLYNRGVEGIIEGCTEIVMLVQQGHTTILLFDTTNIHDEIVLKHVHVIDVLK